MYMIVLKHRVYRRQSFNILVDRHCRTQERSKLDEGVLTLVVQFSCTKSLNKYLLRQKTAVGRDFWAESVVKVSVNRENEYEDNIFN